MIFNAKTRLLAFLLCAIMLLSLFSCNESDETTDTGETTDSADDPTEEASTAPAEETSHNYESEEHTAPPEESSQEALPKCDDGACVNTNCNDMLCDICMQYCGFASPHTNADCNDGYCDVCGKNGVPASPHVNTECANSRCDNCGIECGLYSEHTNADCDNTLCDICGKNGAPAKAHAYGEDGICTGCGENKNAVLILSPSDLNVGSGFRLSKSVISDGISGKNYYHVTGSKTSADYGQYIWLREPYKGSSGEMAGSGSQMSDSLNIGRSRYMLVRARTNHALTASGNISLTVSSTAWNYTDTQSTGASSIGTEVMLIFEELDTWTTFVIDLSILENRFAPDPTSGDYILDTFYLNFRNSSSSTYLDIEYIAFAESFELIDELVDDLYVRLVSATSGISSLMYANGTPLGSNRLESDLQMLCADKLSADDISALGKEYKSINIGSARYLAVKLGDAAVSDMLELSLGTSGADSPAVMKMKAESGAVYLIDLISLIPESYKLDPIYLDYIITSLSYSGAEVGYIAFADSLEGIAYMISEPEYYKLTDTSGETAVLEDKLPDTVCANFHPFTVDENGMHSRASCEWHGIEAVEPHEHKPSADDYSCEVCSYIPMCGGVHLKEASADGKTHSVAACKHCGSEAKTDIPHNIIFRSTHSGDTVIYSYSCSDCSYTEDRMSANASIGAYELASSSAYRGEISYTDNCYRMVTMGQHAQHIWLREPYKGSNGDVATGGSAFDENINIGTAKYLVIKLRTDIEAAKTGSIGLYLSSTSLNLDTEGVTGTGIIAVAKKVKLTVPEMNKWTLLVLDLTLLGNSFAKDPSGDYVIDTLFLDVPSNAAGNYIDIKFIAFADSLEEIGGLVSDGTAVKITSLNGDSTVISLPGGSSTDGSAASLPEHTTDGLGEKALGGTVEGAGAHWTNDMFALTLNSIDESSAIKMTPEEMLSLLTDKNALKKGQVYTVEGKLSLSSDTVYYGNGAAVIASDGIEIVMASNVTIKELIIKGNIVITNSMDVSFYKTEIKGGDVAISIDSECDRISLKSCIVSARGDAINSGAAYVNVYQSRLIADRCIVSSGNDLTVQSSVIHAASLGISAIGDRVTVRENTLSVYDHTGVGVEIGTGSQNALVALNEISNAQSSVTVSGSHNCVVILNRLVSVNGENNTNFYCIKNRLGGYLTLKNNKYLIADGNDLADGDGCVISIGNTEYNGDSLHDVDARLEYGANEELLPHANKEQFVGMERREKVNDGSYSSRYSLAGYIQSSARNGNTVIVPPGAYTIPRIEGSDSAQGFTIGALHSNTAIYCYGVYAEADYLGQITEISYAENIELYGLTWGYTKPPSAQLHIIKKLGDGKLLAVTAAGYEGEAFGKLDGDSHGYWPSGNIWSKDSDAPLRSTKSGYTIEKNEDGTFILSVTDSEYAASQLGDIWTCRLDVDRIQTVKVLRSSNISFKDVTINGYGNAVHWRNSEVENVSYYRAMATPRSAFIIDKETYDYYKSLEEQYGVDLEVYIDEAGRYRGSTPRHGGTGTMDDSNSTVGINLTSCILEYLFDDASNQHSTSSRLTGITDNGDGTYTVYYKGCLSVVYHNGENSKKTEKNNFFPGSCAAVKKGDKLFSYGSNGAVLFDGAVALSDAVILKDASMHLVHEDANGDGICDLASCGRSIFVSSSPKLYLPVTNAKYDPKTGMLTYNVARYGTLYQDFPDISYSTAVYSVTVRADNVNLSALDGYDLLSNDYDPASQFFFDNASRNSFGYTIDNVLIQTQIARGVLIKSENVTIKHTTFRDVCLSGIIIGKETNWGESTVPRYITIKNCIFDNTGSFPHNVHDPEFAQINIQGLGGVGDFYDSVALREDFACSDIVITHNKFLNTPNRYIINASGARNITLTDNVFEELAGGGRVLNLNCCLNVTISGNTYSEKVNNVISLCGLGKAELDKSMLNEVFTLNNYRNVTIEGVKLPDSEAVK